MTDDLKERLRANHLDECYDAIDRIEQLQAQLAKAVEVIEWALICWDDHNKHGYNMEGDWVSDARTTLAELKGGENE
jgi:hypothetical protein